MPEERPGYPAPYPPPPGYAPPPGGMPPPTHPPTESPTVKGLLFMLIAGILIIIGQFVCAILTIIGYILAIIGFFKIYGDRYSYPEPHPTNMKYSLIFYILGVIIIIIGIIIIIFATVGLVFSAIGGGLTISEFFERFLLYMVISIIIISIGSLFIIFGRYKLLVELMAPNHKGILKFALILAVILIFIGLIIAPFLFIELKGAFEGEDEELDEDNTEILQKKLQEFQAEIFGLSMMSTILGLISEILFIICFYLAYDYQKTNPQAQRGAIQPPRY